MCTASSSQHRGSLSRGFPDTDPLGQRHPHPQTEIPKQRPPDWDPPTQGPPYTETPRRNIWSESETLPKKEHGTRQPDRWHHTETPSPAVDRMTDMCKNITLPQTSFAGGNNQILKYGMVNLLKINRVNPMIIVSKITSLGNVSKFLTCTLLTYCKWKISYKQTVWPRWTLAVLSTSLTQLNCG